MPRWRMLPPRWGPEPPGRPPPMPPGRTPPPAGRGPPGPAGLLASYCTRRGVVPRGCCGMGTPARPSQTSMPVLGRGRCCGCCDSLPAEIEPPELGAAVTEGADNEPEESGPADSEPEDIPPADI